MKRLIILSIVLSILFPCLSFGYTTFLPEQHPRVAAKFWYLPSFPPQSAPPQGYGFGPEGEGEGVPGEPVLWIWGWSASTLRFLRGLDVIRGSNVHILTYHKEPVAGDSVVSSTSETGLSHGHFGIWYDHHDNAYNYSGTKQDLLGKSNWGLQSRGYGQVFFSSCSIEKIESVNLRESHWQHPKRELADWLTPAWFCLAVGGVISHDISDNEEGPIQITLTDSYDAANFKHHCWGRNTNNCKKNGDENDDKYDVRYYTYAIILPTNYEGMEIIPDPAYWPPYEILKITGINEATGELIAERDQFHCPKCCVS